MSFTYQFPIVPLQFIHADPGKRPVFQLFSPHQSEATSVVALPEKHRCSVNGHRYMLSVWYQAVCSITALKRLNHCRNYSGLRYQLLFLCVSLFP
ncbi:hypothetical protein XENOCAPTIV_022473, partial [Xenoophorus captivus]